MGYYINEYGNYYEGDRQPGSIAVPQRSDPDMQLIDGAWVLPLSVLKSRKSAAISAACAAQITGGATSSALGTAHTYPTKPTDQGNLDASITDSLLPVNASNASYTTPFWCEDSTGNWAWVAHTAAQIQQVGIDIKAAILAAQNKNANLQSQIDAATSASQLDTINW